MASVHEIKNAKKSCDTAPLKTVLNRLKNHVFCQKRIVKKNSASTFWGVDILSHWRFVDTFKTLQFKRGLTKSRHSVQ